MAERISGEENGEGYMCYHCCPGKLSR
jgi:hypothetical protein